MDTLTPWGNARKNLPLTASPTDVVAEVDKFEDATKAVKAWAGV